MMVKCDPRHGKYMACCMMYRGCLAEITGGNMFALRKFTAGLLERSFMIIFLPLGSVMPVAVAYFTAGTRVCIGRLCTYL